MNSGHREILTLTAVIKTIKRLNYRHALIVRASFLCYKRTERPVVIIQSEESK